MKSCSRFPSTNSSPFIAKCKARATCRRSLSTRLPTAHYKDLEAGKWVKVEDWVGPEEAKKAIQDGVKRYKAAKRKPRY